MDSLLANYASSGEEEEEEHEKSPPLPSSSAASKAAASLFSSLPQPKTPLFSSLSQPKQQSSTNPKIQAQIEEQAEEDDDEEKGTRKRTPLFSSLPQPKSQQQPISNSSTANPNRKRVVQFKPPSMKPSHVDLEGDDDEEENEAKRRRQSESSLQSSSVMSFLSSIPAPRNSSTLGVMPSAAGSARRSIIETDTPSSSIGVGSVKEPEPVVDQYTGNYGVYDAGYANYEGNGEGYDSGNGQIASGGDGGSYGGYESYGSYENYSNYGQNGSSNWGDGSVTAAPETTGKGGESAVRVFRKNGRNEIPTEILEVKQDELMKDRPREDQVKLTGIAFGPSYQPASTKGKPTKLHKRKHQIGSLYFDMKQKEMELAERRAKGFLTKAQTHAKYGW